MKLIDLLVQELPKRGGWPDSVSYELTAWLHKNRITFVIDCNGSYFEGYDGFRVNREQYGAASQKVEWDGN